MSDKKTETILRQVQDGSLTVEEAMLQLKLGDEDLL